MGESVPAAFTDNSKTEVPLPSEKVPEMRRFAIDPVGKTVGTGSG